MTPLEIYPNEILFLVRIIIGVVVIYHGYPKIKNLRKNTIGSKNIESESSIVWKTLTGIIEFFGGIAIILGIFSGPVALLIAIEMFINAIWKARKAKKPFTDYSYDLLLLALALVILTFGAGSYNMLP